MYIRFTNCVYVYVLQGSVQGAGSYNYRYESQTMYICVTNHIYICVTNDINVCVAGISAGSSFLISIDMNHEPYINMARAIYIFVTNHINVRVLQG